MLKETLCTSCIHCGLCVYSGDLIKLNEKLDSIYRNEYTFSVDVKCHKYRKKEFLNPWTNGKSNCKGDFNERE